MEIIPTPWAVGLTIAFVGILGTFAVNRWLSFGRASRDFRAAIDRELGSVAVTWPQDIDAFLRSRYPALLSAVIEFRHYVPWWRKCGFDSAWRCFYNANPSGYDHQCYDHYTEILSSERPIPNVRAIFHANVECLLSYAKET